MADGDTTIVKFQAGESADAKTKIESLSVANNDVVISWQQNNEVSVAKIERA